MLKSGPLAALCRAVNDDKIDRSANHRVIENASHEAPGSPSPGVEIGAALVQLRSLNNGVVSMHDMAALEAGRIAFGIAFPEQRSL